MQYAILLKAKSFHNTSTYWYTLYTPSLKMPAGCSPVTGGCKVATSRYFLRGGKMIVISCCTIFREGENDYNLLLYYFGGKNDCNLLYLVNKHVFENFSGAKAWLPTPWLQTSWYTRWNIDWNGNIQNISLSNSLTLRVCYEVCT